MAHQYHQSFNSQLSPISGQNGEKRPYQYEEVSVDDRTTKATARDQRMKSKIRLLRVIQRLLTLIISVIVLGIMVNTYVTFRNNRTIQSGGQTIPIYPVDPITWPTYLMIGTGAVSIIFNSAIMVAYFWGVSASNGISMWSTYWNYLSHIVNLGIWLGTSTAFQMSKGPVDAVPPPRDIYGWTCSNKVDELSAQFKKAIPVNFDLQCKTQQITFAVGIVNAGMEVFAICISLYALRRLIYKKRMGLMDQRGVATGQ